MPLQQPGHGPYAPSAAVMAIIDAFRNRGLGTPITTDVLIRAGVTESLAPRTLQALRALELIDQDGNPTAQFEALRQARGDDEFRASLQEWLRAEYAEVLGFADPAQEPPERIAEAFRGYEPNGQRSRMATLMIGLWQYAGLPVLNHSEEAKPRRPQPERTMRAPKVATVRKQTGRAAPAGTLSDLPPGLVGLLHQIPTGGKAWSPARREEFLKAFAAVLDFSVPIGDDDAGVDSS